MPAAKATTAITIGNFDGVHVGHVKLVSTARSLVGDTGRVVAVFFDPHPTDVLRGFTAIQRLSTATQRERWLKQAGADDCIAVRPTRDYLAQMPSQFVEGIVRQFVPRFIVEGSDFRFGKGRAGSVQTLHDLAEGHGYETVVVDAVQATLTDQSLVDVRSSLIRWLLERGRVHDARLLLGRPYQLEAEVVAGEKRGRALGMPTMNLGHVECLLPADGIYAGAARLPDGACYPAAISVGTKPTFGAHPRVCEAHLIGYNGPLDDYGWTLTLEFHHWLRDQLKYSSVDRLIDQLQRDIHMVKERSKENRQSAVLSGFET